MDDHTETIEMDFDPTIISYEELLQLFWKNHNPLRGQFYGGRQYMSLLLYHNGTQKELVEKTKREWERTLEGKIKTEIAPCEKFYRAEDYHQKYYLKRYGNAVEMLKRIFPTEADFTDATITARLNGLVKGYVTLDDIKSEIGDWHLNDDQARDLIVLVNQLSW